VGHQLLVDLIMLALQLPQGLLSLLQRLLLLALPLLACVESTPRLFLDSLPFGGLSSVL
jgi:hypothetical protein